MDKEYVMRFKVILDEKENEGATGISAFFDLVGALDDVCMVLDQETIAKTIRQMAMRLVKEIQIR